MGSGDGELAPFSAKASNAAAEAPRRREMRLLSFTKHDSHTLWRPVTDVLDGETPADGVADVLRGVEGDPGVFAPGVPPTVRGALRTRRLEEHSLQKMLPHERQ